MIVCHYVNMYLNSPTESAPRPAWSAGRPRPATTVRARAGGQFCARQFIAASIPTSPTLHP